MKTTLGIKMLAIVSLLTMALPQITSAQTKELSDAELENLVRRSYQYVAMYNVNNKFAETRDGYNSVLADTELKDHTFTDIARPNNDTLYITAMLDVRKEPMIVRFPAFDSKYVSLMVTGYDHYVNVPMTTRLGDFRSPETVLFYTDRTEGYAGEDIEGVDRAFHMTGDFLSAIVRVMPHSSEPERFKRIAGQMKAVEIFPLSKFLGRKAVPDSAVTFPAVGKTDADIFGTNLPEVMQFVFNHTTFDPQDPLDVGVLAAWKPLGIVPGGSVSAAAAMDYDRNRFRQMAETVAESVLGRMEDEEYISSVLKFWGQSKGNTTLEGVLAMSVAGPIGLPGTEAAYPVIFTTDGSPLNASQDYVIRMSAEELPPAKAFWSITLYDLERGFFIPNDQFKYSVGENAGMKLDANGGIEIHIAAEQPEGVPAENWLPIKRDGTNLSANLRIYVPDLDRMKTWTAPRAEPVSPPSEAGAGTDLTPAEAKKIAHEAYVYGISAVDNYRVYFRALTDPTHPVQISANTFNHFRELVGPELGDTPNNDALFSYAILDLRREPVVISVPKVEDDRLYMLQLGDTSTETLPYISSIATGTGAGHYAIVGPDFASYLPAEKFDGIITTLGQFVAVTGRTAVDGPDDVPAVIAIQKGITLTSLSAFLGTEAPTDPGPLNFLPWDDKKAAGIGVFDYINMGLAWQLPTLAEVPMLERFALIGVMPGKRFTTEGLSPEIVAAIEDGVKAAKAQIQEVMASSMAVDIGGGWLYTLENIAQFGDNYLLRAAVSREQIYPNTPDHAMYGIAREDGDGNTLTGAHAYTVTFPDGGLPPVNGFWSLTMYDNATTAMVPNELKRYAIGDRTEGLVYGDDGSLKICLQVQAPDEPTCNWLPAPQGQFYVIVRLYAPKEEASSGKWTPPAVVRRD